MCVGALEYGGEYFYPTRATAALSDRARQESSRAAGPHVSVDPHSQQLEPQQWHKRFDTMLYHAIAAHKREFL